MEKEIHTNWQKLEPRTPNEEAGERAFGRFGVWEQELHEMLRLDCRALFLCAWPASRSITASQTLFLYIILFCTYTGVVVAKCWSQFPFGQHNIFRKADPELKQQPRHARYFILGFSRSGRLK
jgi:hypothetical protein